jgi:hypothetical protein
MKRTASQNASPWTQHTVFRQRHCTLSALHRCGITVRLQGRCVVAHNEDTLKQWIRFEFLSDFPKGDHRRPFDGESIGACTDGRKGDGQQLKLSREQEGVSVAVGQKTVFIVVSAVPDGTYGMDNVFRRKIVPLCDLRPARWTSVQRAAFLKKTRSGCTVDCTIDSPAAEQRSIRRIHNRIYGLYRDVTLKDGKSFDRGTAHGSLVQGVVRLKMVREGGPP